jgi:hypothetical protein
MPTPSSSSRDGSSSEADEADGVRETSEVTLSVEGGDGSSAEPSGGLQWVGVEAHDDQDSHASCVGRARRAAPGLVEERTSCVNSWSRAWRASLDLLRVFSLPMSALVVLQLGLVAFVALLPMREWRTSWGPRSDSGEFGSAWAWPLFSAATSVSIVVWSVSLIAWNMWPRPRNNSADDASKLSRWRLGLQTALFSMLQGGIAAGLLVAVATESLSLSAYRYVAGGINLVVATVHGGVLVPANKLWFALAVGVVALAIGLYFSILTVVFFSSDSVLFRFFFRLLIHPAAWNSVSFFVRLIVKQGADIPENTKGTLVAAAKIAESLFGRILIVGVGELWQTVLLAFLVGVFEVLGMVALHFKDRFVEERVDPNSRLAWFVSSFRASRLYCDTKNVQFLLESVEVVAINASLLLFSFNPADSSCCPNTLGVILTALVQLAFALLADLATRAVGEYHGYSFLFAYHTRSRGWTGFALLFALVSLNFVLVVAYSRSSSNVAG